MVAARDVLLHLQSPGYMVGGATAGHVIREQSGVPGPFSVPMLRTRCWRPAKLVELYAYILKPSSERQLKAVLEVALRKSAADVRLKKIARLSNHSTGDSSVNTRMSNGSPACRMPV